MATDSTQLQIESLEGHAVKAFIFFCADCAETTVQYSAAGSHPVDLPTAAAWARDMGWKKRQGLWRCPTHAVPPTKDGQP